MRKANAFGAKATMKQIERARKENSPGPVFPWRADRASGRIPKLLRVCGARAMSMELHAFMRRDALPTRAAWQAAIDRLGLPIVLDPSLEAETANGFWPCRVDGRDGGVEVWIDPADGISLGDDPHAPQRVAGLDAVVSFRWGSRIDAMLCALGLAAVLAAEFGAQIHDPQMGVFAEAESLRREFDESLLEARKEAARETAKEAARTPAPPPPIPDIIVRSSIRRYLFLFILSVSLPIAVNAMGITGELWFLGTILVLGIPIFGWKLLDRRPVLTINGEGILDRRAGGGLVPWSNIAGSQIISHHNYEFVSLTLRDPSLYLAKLGRMKRLGVQANQRFGFGDYAILISDLKIERDQLLRLIGQMIQLHRPSQGSLAQAPRDPLSWRQRAPDA